MNAYRILVGKPEGKRPLGRPMYRWEGNIKTHLKGCDVCGLNSFGLRQKPRTKCSEQNSIMKLQFPRKAENFLTS
jgi:hypothetical protein